MWLPSLPVHVAALAASPVRILAATAGPTSRDLLIILRVVCAVIAILRLFRRDATGRFTVGPKLLIVFICSTIIIAATVAARIYFPPPARSSPATDQMARVQAIVTAYMYSRAASPSSIQFLEWSNLQTNGPDLRVTVHYRAVQHSGDRVTATVRFTIHGGAVTNAEVLSQG
jgi:hypothetical protein